MGRGCGWSDTDLANLARAWVQAREDPVTGIEQTAGRFRCTMFARFKELEPRDSSKKTYGGRTAKSVRAKFDEVAADVQNFRHPFRLFRACNPTGVTQDEVLSMEISVHLGKRKYMAYEAPYFPHCQWRKHLSFRVLSLHPKLSDEGTC